MAILAEEGLARLNTVTPKTVTTPCGTYEGLAAPASETICGVDIVRSGGILLEAVRKIAPDSRHTRNFKRIGQDSSRAWLFMADFCPFAPAPRSVLLTRALLAGHVPWI